MRVFVTGATGHVGSAVAAAFARAGHETYGLLRSPSKAPALEAAEVVPVAGTMEEPEGWRETAERCSVLVHCAVDASESSWDLHRATLGALREAARERTARSTRLHPSLRKYASALRKPDALKVEIEVDVRPEVTLPALDSLTVEIEAVEVDEAAVDSRFFLPTCPVPVEQLEREFWQIVDQVKDSDYLRLLRAVFGNPEFWEKFRRAPSAVSQIVRAVKPDIIHANSLPALLAANKSHVSAPVVWHVRDLHLPILVAREAAKKAARIIAASDAIDEYLVGFLSPRILGNIRVIRNGIDPARFESADRVAARQRLGLPQDAPVSGMVAHLTPWKRHDAFIQAAAAIQ